jgi:hypothetical protein
MSFIQREIELVFTLGSGTFADSGTNTVTLKGLRIQCQITSVVGPGMGRAHLRVHGLTLSLLNDLCSIVPVVGGVPKVVYNQLTINAGDSESGMTRVFQGNTTLSSSIDMNSSPDSVLEVNSAVGSFQAVQSIEPTSYPGSASAPQIMGALASLTPEPLVLEANTVATVFQTPYFPGSRRDQMMRCAEAGGFNWTIENGTLALWARDGYRIKPVPTISPETGMVGYPSNIGIGAQVKTLFNPNILCGGRVNVQSSLRFATGNLLSYHISHQLDSRTPGGRWFTTFRAYPTVTSAQAGGE